MNRMRSIINSRFPNSETYPTHPVVTTTCHSRTLAKEADKRPADLRGHFPRADCMTAPAGDFRHIRFFRSLTRRAAILTVGTGHTATLRIPAFSLLIVTHGLVSSPSRNQSFPKCGASSTPTPLWTLRFLCLALCRIRCEERFREVFHVRLATNPASRSRPTLPGTARRHAA